MTPSAFAQAAALLHVRSFDLPGLVGCVSAPELVDDPITGGAPPFLLLPGGICIGYSAAFASPELWLEIPSPAHDAAMDPAGAAAQAGAKLGVARHPLTGAPALCLHACGSEELLRGALALNACAVGDNDAKRAYSQLLLWVSLALPLVGLQPDTATCAGEAARLAAM